jgi:hypothetical protein
MIRRFVVAARALSCAFGMATLQACMPDAFGTGPNAYTIADDAAADATSSDDSSYATVPDAPTADGAAEASDAPTADEENDVDGAADANPAIDAGVPDPPCPGLRCNGECITDTDCRSCPGAPLLCAVSSECVTRCAACGGRQEMPNPIECFACDKNHQNPVGTCQPNDATSYCLSGNDFGSYLGGANGYFCACGDAGVNGCPGEKQVCAPIGRGSFCLSCGQISSATVEGVACSGGGVCHEAQRACN